MLIKVGHIVKTSFCTGIVMEILHGGDLGWDDTIYYRIKVTDLVLHWRHRIQTIKISEVKSKHVHRNRIRHRRSQANGARDHAVRSRKHSVKRTKCATRSRHRDQARVGGDTCRIVQGGRSEERRV